MSVENYSGTDIDGLLELGFKDMSHLIHPGIYILCCKGEIVYVGKSINPLSRIGNHHGTIEFAAVYFLRCPKNAQSMNISDISQCLTIAENQFIEWLEPPSNIVGWGCGRVRERRINIKTLMHKMGIASQLALAKKYVWNAEKRAMEVKLSVPEPEIKLRRRI
jgi:hypothetical protein